VVEDTIEWIEIQDGDEDSDSFNEMSWAENYCEMQLQSL
jgi:hypothetical protein